MLGFVSPRQLQVFVWSLLRFLDESVQQYHPALLVDVEKYARDSVLGQARPHFINGVPQRPANRHPDWPTELYRLDVLANPLAVLIEWQTLQPIPQRFSAGVRPKEDYLNSFALLFKPLG